MLAKLRAWNDILYRDASLLKIGANNHYMKFYYKDKPALGFRDFYLKYWRGDRMVTIKPKRDRKKNIIPGKFEVYGKRGNYVFTAYQYWFEWIERIGTQAVMKKKDWVTNPAWPEREARVKARQNALGNLSWNDLFEV